MQCRIIREYDDCNITPMGIGMDRIYDLGDTGVGFDTAKLDPVPYW